jgi:hypothetical protein
MIDKNWYNEFYRRQQKPAHTVPPQIVQPYKELRHLQLISLERRFELLGNVEAK